MLWLQEAFLRAKDESILTPELLEHIRSILVLEWSDRMSRTVGLALYSKKTSTAIIRLSTVLWKVAPETEKRETVFHELAHIMVDAMRAHDPVRAKFRGRRNAHHGPEWVRVMTALGYPNPRRCHDLFNEEYERAQGNVPLYCQCKSEPVVWTTPARAERARGHRCRKCLALLQTTPTTPAGQAAIDSLNEIFELLLGDRIDPRAYTTYTQKKK